jgi:hypothetical protein
MKTGSRVRRRSNSDVDHEIRPPYLRSNERGATRTTLDTCPIGVFEITATSSKVPTESGFLRHGRQKE